VIARRSHDAIASKIDGSNERMNSGYSGHGGQRDKFCRLAGGQEAIHLIGFNAPATLI
jgi:hypothetical protein